MVLRDLTPRARFRVILILSGALVIFAIQGFGQRYEFSPACEKAYHSVLMFRFDEARDLLEQEKVSDPQNLLPFYIENYIDFLILFTDENRGYFDQVTTAQTAGGRRQVLSLLQVLLVGSEHPVGFCTA
jgi:hypothetical protein